MTINSINPTDIPLHNKATGLTRHTDITSTCKAVEVAHKLEDLSIERLSDNKAYFDDLMNDE